LPLLLWGLLGAVLLGVVGAGMWSLTRPPSPTTSLPVYGSVPDFALTDQLRRPLRRLDLEGKIWIANFIYTNCPDECPLMTAEMAKFQDALTGVPELRLVSITVDPAHDTPEVLWRYAEGFRADPAAWFFLTGDKAAIYRLARDGFKLGIIDPSERPPASRHPENHPSPAESAFTHCTPSPPKAALRSSVTRQQWWQRLTASIAFADHGRAVEPLHSTRFVLVDPQSQIRGYYDSQDGAALQRLCQHLQILRQGR
jgi:protein SCO1/2